MVLAVAPLVAAERTAIAHLADLALVGKLENLRLTVDPTGALLVRGELVVQEVLFGRLDPSGRRIAYQWDCWGCRDDLTAADLKYIEEVGVWFLRAANGGGWEAGGIQEGDPGRRPLHDLEEYRRVFAHRRATDKEPRP